MKPKHVTLGLRRLILAPIAIQLVAVSASADTISLTPTADAFVVAAQPNNNYGGAGALCVAAPGLAQGEFQSVLRFDTSSAVAQFNATYGVGNWSIDAVSLRLTAAPPNNAIFNQPAAGQFAAHWMQNDSWVEGTGTPAIPTTNGITFATLPSFVGGSDEDLGTLTFPGGTSATIAHALGITPLFLADIESGGPVGIRLDAADAAVSYLFNSRSNGTVPSRPALSITAIPEPTSALLLLIALGIAARSRKGVGC